MQSVNIFGRAITEYKSFYGNQMEEHPIAYASPNTEGHTIFGLGLRGMMFPVVLLRFSIIRTPLDKDDVPQHHHHVGRSMYQRFYHPWIGPILVILEKTFIKKGFPSI